MDPTWKKYDTYAVAVDPDQNDRSQQLCAWRLDKRPHMRALSLAFVGTLIASWVWFGIASTLSMMRNTLRLTKYEIWESSLHGTSALVGISIVTGVLCDQWGATRVFALCLVWASLTACWTGRVVESAQDLIHVRGMLAMAGASYVVGQYWTTAMFGKQVVGRANALVGGAKQLGTIWFANRLMTNLVVPWLERRYDNDEEQTWRTALVIPGIIGIVMSLAILFLADDTPKGNVRELRTHGVLPKVFLPLPSSVTDAAASTAMALMLCLQHAAAMGVELTMMNAAALHYQQHFDFSTEGASHRMERYYWLHLPVRFLLGGCLSDAAGNSRFGMRGRLGVQFVLLLVLGLCLVVFDELTTSQPVADAVLTLLMFSSQAAQGSTFGLAPFVSEALSGTIFGLVGGTGYAGSIAFSMAFRRKTMDVAYRRMAVITLASAVSVLVLCFPVFLNRFLRAAPARDEDNNNNIGQETTANNVHDCVSLTEVDNTMKKDSDSESDVEK